MVPRVKGSDQYGIRSKRISMMLRQEVLVGIVIVTYICVAVDWLPGCW